MSEPYRLYGAKGSGSMIVEAAFTRTGAPVEFIDLDWDDVGWSSKTLAPLNPLGQVPTVVMPDGKVMTESAAIILHLADRYPHAGLVPAVDDPLRPTFLRWLVFLVSAVYPTFTYGDAPKRWVGGDEAAGKLLRTGTDEHRNMLWQYVERHVDGPWFLGAESSALDLYMWPMTVWRPGRDWFKQHCPKLHAIGVAMDVDAVCHAVAVRNGL